MILRLGAKEDLFSERGVPEHAYTAAINRFMKEDYSGARREIAEAPVLHRPGNDPSCVEYKKAVALYCVCCAYDKKFDELERLKELIGYDTICRLPDIHIAYMWYAIYRGKWENLLDGADQYLQENRHQIDEYLPYYYFFYAYATSKIGQPGEAIQDAEIARSLFLIHNNDHYAAQACNLLGILYRQLSQYQISLNWYSHALSYYDKMGMKRKQSMVKMNIGVTYYKLARYAEAKECLEQSLRIGIKGKWIHRQCFANVALGNLLRLQRDFESARRHLHTAYGQAQALANPREEALSLEFLGDIYRDEGQFAEARRFYARAKAIAESNAPGGDIVMEVHRRIGECYFHEQDMKSAMNELHIALEMTRSVGDRFEEAVVLRNIAEVMGASDDLAGARLRIDQSIHVLRDINVKHELANSLLFSAQLAIEEADRYSAKRARDALDQAWAHATSALDLYLQVDVTWYTEQARQLVDRIARRRAARDRADADGRTTYQPGDVIIHTSQAMKDLLQLTDMFAGSGEPVLVTGETGTGKELIARRIHARSTRAKGPLVTVNVAAIPATVFEREFFGHVRGAFSGADRDQPGFAAKAHGGTLFLDEIGDLPLSMQPKLLRLLQEGTYQAIGDPAERRTEVRLVAATNADLAKLVADGRFRADLWYRLRVLELDLPPVRERPEDVRPLLRHFLSLAAGRPVEPAEVFDPESLATAAIWPWPGNVREIAMIARRAHMEKQTRGRVCVEIAAGERRATLHGGTAARAMVAAEGALLPSGASSERARIVAALERCQGNRLEAARLLGLGRSTLYRRMVSLGLPTRKS